MAQDRIAGLVVSDGVVEWTTLPAKGRGKAIGSRRVELAAAVVDAEADESVESAASVAESIKAECKPLKGSRIAVGIGSDRLLLRVIELPLVDDAELSGMVDLQIDKFSPFPVDSMVVAYEVLRREAEHCLVLIAAVQEDVASELGRLLTEADVHSDRLDAIIVGWWRLILDAGRVHDAGRQVFLIFETGSPEMIVTQDGMPILFRSITGVAEVSDEDAVQELVAEVAHSLMSLELEHGGGAATSMQLWYRNEVSEGIVGALARECECEVETADLESLPMVSEGLARRMVQRGASALDLTPASWRTAEAARSFRAKVLVSAACVVATCAIILVGLFGAIAYQRHGLAAMNAELESLSGPAADVKKMRGRVQTIAEYMDRSRSGLECLREICLVLPNGIDLTSYSYRKGESLKISGEAANVNLVYALKNKLDESELFLESELIGPHRNTRSKKEIFEIGLTLPGEKE